MSLCIGSKPCKYNDCCHFIEDCADYKTIEHCKSCREAYHNKKPIKITKEKDCLDRYAPLGTKTVRRWW